MSKTIKRALAASFMVAVCSSAAQAAEPITIALAGPVTGPAAAAGADMKAGAIAAIKAINERGGVLGRPLALHIEDDSCLPDKAVNVANRIIARNIRFVVGHYCSTATLPAAGVYHEYGVMQVTLSQANKITEQGYPRLFRITPNAGALAESYTNAIVEVKKSAQKIALIGTNDDYARSIADSIVQSLNKKGIKIDHRDFYPPGETDFSALISRLKAQQTDMVLIAGNEKEMGMIVRQSADFAFKPQFLLSSTAASADFPAITGCTGASVRVVAAWNPLYEENGKILREQLRAEGANGIDVAFNAYAAIMAVAAGIRGAGEADPNRVATYMKENKVALPIGITRFTEKGELANPKTIIYKYQGVGSPCVRVEMRPATP